MPSVTDPIPGTTSSYNDHWAKTSSRTYDLWKLLTQDAVPAPTVDEDGVPLTPEQLASNPNWYLANYLKNTLEELRELRRETREGHATLVVDVKQALLAAVPELARQIADQIDQLDPVAVQPVVERAVRNVLGSLNDVA